MSKELNDILYHKVKQSGLKMNYLASTLRLSRKGLYLKFAGKIPFKEKEIEVIEKLLDGIRGGGHDK